MGKSDVFRRTLEAGTSLLGMSRERAEAIVKEWVEAGDMGKGKAQRAIDDLLERSRRATEDMRDLIRREISAQLQSMGVATRDDIARLEAKLDAAGAAAATTAPTTSAAVTSEAVVAAAQRAAAQKAAAKAIVKKAAAQRATAKAIVKKATAKKATAKKAAAATKRATTTPSPGPGPSTPTSTTPVDPGAHPGPGT